MDFNKARTFVTVVDSGSVTLAANRLLRTQQAISLQVQQLEEEIGCYLFDRKGPKIVLTMDGETLYREFKPQLLAMENAVLSLKSQKRKVNGLIRIGAWMEQAVGYLPEMIRLFKVEFPRVEFSLHTAEDAEIERMLEQNAIDIGFQVFSQNKKLFRVESIYQQPLVPVVSKLFLDDTLELPLVDYVGEYSAYHVWVKKNARELLPAARKKTPTITASNNVVLKQLVLQGLGFGFLHLDSIAIDLKAGELVPLIRESQYKNMHVDIDVVYKRRDALSFIHKYWAY